MSTFKGHVREFPEIRIDYFRPLSATDTSPLAYFLSHVHSDHLTGLDSCRSPFIYCSPATRDIVLRLEKYPHRMNFAKGILETRKQTYRHLKTLLKAIPLEVPTTIELRPGRRIRVTLFDANHCVGAVMFLIEDANNAILYTGDVRSEAWWVNSLVRNPLLVPYTTTAKGTASHKKLDCIYLDTTFVAEGKEDPYREFPSKAHGLEELLVKVAQYPKDTLFYLDAWTFGYEDIWLALSSFLGEKVHVDEYRYGLYQALANGIEPKAAEAAKLVGFYCGNHYQEGCLTTKQSRLHSCERGTECEVWSKDFVRITPIISRHNGIELAELGAGGGQGDLDQRHELEVFDNDLVGKLMALCASKLHSNHDVLNEVLQILAGVVSNGTTSLALDHFTALVNGDDGKSNDDHQNENEEISLESFVSMLAKAVSDARNGTSVRHELQPSGLGENAQLARRITFPYSRHASYNELCMLLEAFQPKDIFPCTVDETNWTLSRSMSFLFGHIFTTSPSFRHDQMMMKRHLQDPVDAIRCESSGSYHSAHSVVAIGNGQTVRHGRENSLGQARSDHSLSRNNTRKVYHPSATDETGERSHGEASLLEKRLASTAIMPGLEQDIHQLDGGQSSIPWSSSEAKKRRRMSLDLARRAYLSDKRFPEEQLAFLDPRKLPPPKAIGVQVGSQSPIHTVEMDEIAEARLALRTDAQNAALLHGHGTRCSLGLISVDGHQTKEIEM